MEQEDTKWKQRVEQNWYQNGDRNMPFFHARADHSHRINHIRSIKDEEGWDWRKKKEIPKVFTNFYQRLFTTEGTVGVEDYLETLEPQVTAEMNKGLIKEFTMVDIDEALAQMHPFKSSGPDGFSACFYQQS